MVNSPELGQDTLYGPSERGAPIALDVLDSVIQYRLQAALVFLLVAVIGVFFAVISPSIYVADTLIQVEDKRANPVPGVQQIAQALNVGENNIQGELDILKSRDVIDRAINALSLNVAVIPIDRVPMLADRFERHSGGRGSQLAPPQFGLTSYQWGGEKVVVSQFVTPAFFEGRQFILTATGLGSWSLSEPGGALLATGSVGNITYFNLGGVTAYILVKQIFARPGEKFTVVRLAKYAAYKQIAIGLNAAETVKQSGVIRVTLRS